MLLHTIIKSIIYMHTYMYVIIVLNALCASIPTAVESEYLAYHLFGRILLRVSLKKISSIHSKRLHVMRPIRKAGSDEKGSSNPFEAKWNQHMKRSKSKKSKKNGLPTGLIADGISGRNSIQDQRIGENNPHLSEEDRYLARLQRERSRGTKKRKRFNLSDMLEEEKTAEKPEKNSIGDEFPTKDISATRYTLLQSNIDAETEIRESDPEVDIPPSRHSLDEREERAANDSDSSEETHDSRERTHREVMHEVMVKSKMYKAERQQVKAVDEEQREVLDRELPEIMSLLAKSTKVVRSHNATVDKSKKTDFNYEATFQALANDRRAHATNRLKTVEEKEAEERDRLEELEQTRLARMQGLDSDDEDGNADPEDSFTKVNQSLSTKFVDDVSDKTRRLTEKIENVPFIFDQCPVNPEELSILLCSTAVHLRGVVIERLMKYFALSLNPPVNGPKLQRLLVLLLNRVKTLATSDPKKWSESSQEIDVLVEHIYALSSKYTNLTVEWARDVLYESYHALQNSSSTSLSLCWNASTLLTLRVLAKLFPGSDIRHSVVTPMLLLLSEAMTPNRTKTDSDFAVACFVCTVFLEVSAASTRTSGQVSEFLRRGFARYPRLLSDSSGTKANCISCNKICGDVKSLSLSDCFVDDNDDCKHVGLKISNAMKSLLSAAFFRGRLPCADLVFASLSRTVNGGPQRNGEIGDLLRSQFEKQATARSMLTMYTGTNVFVPKALNPKFAAVSGVYRKHNQNRHKPASMEQIQESAKRVRKALNKEERGYARDLRKESMRIAQHRSELEAEKRAHSDLKSKELKLFLENQQATWNQAAKKQKQLSGKKW